MRLSPLVAAESEALHYNVQSYAVKGGAALSSNTVNSLLSKYTGPSVTLTELANAASILQAAYGAEGYTNLSVAIAPDRITKGTVTVNLFKGAVPQILISGKRYTNFNVELAIARSPNTTANPPAPAKTNAPPGFPVRAYEITGDTLLSTNTLMSIFAKRTGTNVTVNDILQAASDMQSEYRRRGYPTVAVSVPKQQITNGMVKIRVFEGRLSDIVVYKNRYFSSNNVMRALPSLQPGMILSSPIFQAELDRANQSQDRQIYPLLEEGDQPNTTKLRLEVRDRLPLHAKVDFNDQNSPGTPDLRVNSSIVYNNLWQYEHSLGFQYSFSPELYKTGKQWNFYDVPLVANYSGFYRLPLTTPLAISEQIDNQPGSFGYSEGTRKFNLPPPSGVPELNVYASRSTIDTGLQSSDFRTITTTPNLAVTAHNEQEDLTLNQSLGFRLSLPIREFEGIRSTFSAGFDYKNYAATTDKSYVYDFLQAIPTGGGLTNFLDTQYKSPVPTSHRTVRYVPLSLRWDGSRKDATGTTFLGVGYSPNFLRGAFRNGQANFESVTGSTQADGYYHIITAILSREQQVFTNWWLSARAGGQWASQPLISNEQYGLGGVNNVRGYHEGEVFGDTGWHVSLEQKTPPKFIGVAYANHPLTVRGSVYMDYGEVYLLDPQGRRAGIPLWGTGFGGIVSIGATWEARFLFSWPLLSAGTISAYEPRFDFSLSVQF